MNLNQKKNKKAFNFNLNMYINTITPIIRFCKMHNYFHALAVFVCITNNTLIIISSGEEKEKIRNIIKPEGYLFRIYSDWEIYKKILERNIEIVTVFSYTITLFDHIHITPRILSAIEPIKAYNNKQNILSMKDSNVKCYKGQISMLFCDIDEIPQFIKITFIPLCQVIKTYLSEAQYWIDWQYGTKLNSRDVLITFFINSSNQEAIIQKLQLYLYENVSELQLFRIHIPFNRPLNYIDKLPYEIRKKTYNILCRVSEEFVVQTYQEAFSDNKKITHLMYYYLLAAKNYFISSPEFLKTNKRLIEMMTDVSVSSFTKSLLRHDKISEAKDKLTHEYKIQSDKNKVVLYMNYFSLIQDWQVFPKEDDSIQECLTLLAEIRNHLDIKYTNKDNYLVLYFCDFIDKIMNSIDLPLYYKGYIPYCINYLVK